MKKRVKLITTIASLCLAVALMAFGVYAATSVSFGVTSSVSFVMDKVYVSIAGSVTGGTDTTGNVRTYNAASYTMSGEGEGAYQIPNADGGLTVSTKNGAAAAAATWAIGDIALNADKSVVTYTLTITNDGAQDVYVTTDGIKVTETDNDNITVTEYSFKINDTEKTADVSEEALNKQATLTVTFKVAITDVRLAVDVNDLWSPSITIKHAKA